jgi:hypothetical protein
MMLDQDLVAVSPSTTYRVLSAAGLLDRWNGKPSKKGTGFVQPLAPHEHWHIDISYLILPHHQSGAIGCRLVWRCAPRQAFENG